MVCEALRWYGVLQNEIVLLLLSDTTFFQSLVQTINSECIMSALLLQAMLK